MPLIIWKQEKKKGLSSCISKISLNPKKKNFFDHLSKVTDITLSRLFSNVDFRKSKYIIEVKIYDKKSTSES